MELKPYKIFLFDIIGITRVYGIVDMSGFNIVILLKNKHLHLSKELIFSQNYRLYNKQIIFHRDVTGI